MEYKNNNNTTHWLQWSMRNYSPAPQAPLDNVYFIFISECFIAFFAKNVCSNTRINSVQLAERIHYTNDTNCNFQTMYIHIFSHQKLKLMMIFFHSPVCLNCAVWTAEVYCIVYKSGMLLSWSIFHQYTRTSDNWLIWIWNIRSVAVQKEY